MSEATYDQECRFDQHLGWYQSCLLDGEEIAKLCFKPDRMSRRTARSRRLGRLLPGRRP